jgi:hypothetical protein
VVTNKFGHKSWPREIVHFRRQADAEAVLKPGACDSPIEAKDTTHKKLNAVVLRAFMTRLHLVCSGASKSPSVWFPDPTPKVLDQARKVRIVWRDAIEPFSVFQSGATNHPKILSGAKLVRRDGKLGENFQKILCFIETPAEGLDLPLDIRGTPFQRRVWGCPARDSGRVHRDLWGARRPHRPTEICSRRCKRLRCQCPSPGDPVPSRHQKQWHSFRLLLGRRA